MVRFLRIDPKVSGSSPPSAKPSLRVRGVTSSLKCKAEEPKGSHGEDGCFSVSINDIEE